MENSINEFLADFNSCINFNSSELTEARYLHIVKLLKEYMEPYDVRVIYENPECLKIKQLETMLKNDLNIIDSETESNKVDTSKESTENNTNQYKPRIILSLTKNNPVFQKTLTQLCNGLILYVANNQLTTKVIPLKEFNHKANLETITDNYDKYELYEIKDGTIVNLYYHNNWCIGTRNSYDVSQLVWRGRKYIDVFNEVLANMKLTWDAFDKAYTYTIGFNHKDFHPFATTYRNTLWVVKTDDGGCVLPKQLPITKISMRDVMIHKKTAMTDYERDKIVNLGYILRSGDLNYSDVLLESSLYANIKHTIYQIPFIKYKPLRLIFLKYFSDMNFVMLSCYLDNNRKHNLLTLFPQYTNHIEKLGNKLHEVAQRLYAYMRNDRNTPPPTKGICELYNVVKDKYRPGKLQILKNIICRIENIEILYNELYTKQ